MPWAFVNGETEDPLSNNHYKEDNKEEKSSLVVDHSSRKIDNKVERPVSIIFRHPEDTLKYWSTLALFFPKWYFPNVAILPHITHLPNGQLDGHRNNANCNSKQSISLKWVN
jgi:hypothetical protein